MAKGDRVTSGGSRPRVRTKTRTSAPKGAASVGTFVMLSCFVVTALAALNHARSPAPVTESARRVVEERAATPAAESPAQTASSPDLVTDLRTWSKEMTPKLQAYTSQASAGKTLKTREQAMALCAGLTDEVDGMAAVRPAPDAVVESEYRAAVSETKAVVASCLEGNGEQMKSHSSAMTGHLQAMVDRIVVLDPASASEN